MSIVFKLFPLPLMQLLLSLLTTHQIHKHVYCVYICMYILMCMCKYINTTCLVNLVLLTCVCL